MMSKSTLAKYFGKISMVSLLFVLLNTLVVQQTNAQAAQCGDNCDDGLTTPCYYEILPSIPYVSVLVEGAPADLGLVVGGPSCCDQIPLDPVFNIPLDCAQIFLEITPNIDGIQFSSAFGGAIFNQYDLWYANDGCGALDGPFPASDAYCFAQPPANGIAEFMLCSDVGVFTNTLATYLVATGLGEAEASTAAIVDGLCDTTFQVFGLPSDITVTWTPSDYLTSLVDNNHTMAFDYNGPEVTDCAGEVIQYSTTIPAADCVPEHVVTTDVTVYPSTEGTFAAACMDGMVEYTYTTNSGCTDGMTFDFYDVGNNLLQSSNSNVYVDMMPFDGLTDICVEVYRTDAPSCAASTACTQGTCCEAPVFTDCPIDLTVTTQFANCLTVNFPTPMATGVGCAPVSVMQITGPVSGVDDFVLDTPTLIEFEATNAIGQSSICSFNITLQLDADFSLQCPADVLVCSPDAAPWTAMNLDPIYAEDCGMPSDLALEYSVTGATEIPLTPGDVNGVDLNNGFNTVTYRIYLISDPQTFEECSFEVRVSSCLPPDLTCPMDTLTVECGTEDLATWLASVMAVDPEGIQEVTTTYEHILSVENCGNTVVDTYEFTATNETGQTSTCQASYGIVDTEAPVFVEMASDTIVECDGSNNAVEILAWLNSNGGATATDNCSTISWTNNYGDLMNTCGASGSVEVTFTATDECGNANSTTATFTINDNIAPTWEILPQDITIECGVGMNVDAQIQEWLNSAGGADAEDDCSFVVFDYSEPVFSDECGQTGSATVTFTVTDGCSNANSADATITIQDNFGPEFLTLANDTIVECDGAGNAADLASWLANYAGATASDNCSSPVSLSSTFVSTTNSCGGTTISTYNFQAMDECGNVSANSQAKFIIQDNTDPVFTILPSSMTVECDTSSNEQMLSAWLANHGGAEATDACSVDLNFGYVLNSDIDGCGVSGISSYTFFVFDGCGNYATANAQFIIEDNTAPNITLPAMNMSAECDGSNNSGDILNWLNNNGGAQAVDNCSNISWSNDYGAIEADCGNTGMVTVTFTVTDECGNAATTSAVFSINDNTAPTWEISPSPLTIECDGTDDPAGQIAAWLNNVGGGEAEDDCSLIMYTNDYDGLNAGCNAGTGSVSVTFTATDACSNSSQFAVLLTIEDTTPPVITTPASDGSAECDGAGNQAELTAWLNSNGGAAASDLCGNVNWNEPVLLNTIAGCGGTSEAIYLFSASDECGNVSANTSASFFIEDNTSPVIDMEAMDMVIECNGSGNDDDLIAWLENIANAGATDLCSDELSWSWDLIADEDSCGTTGIQSFEFTVEDACGNSSSTVGTFTIEDTTPPVISGGEDYIGACDDSGGNNDVEFTSWLLSNAGASASDVCGNVFWTNDYNVENWEYFCGDSKMITVTFTASDDCGNSESIIHVFSLGDVEAPVFTNCPRPSVIVDAPEGWCSAYANFSAPFATDNCGEVTINQIDETGLGSGDLFPLGLTVLIYEAVDGCGNADTCSFKVIVNDYHLDPTLDCPQDVTMNNDPFVCGAVVNNIAPLNVSDNCPDNVAIIYEIRDEQGEIFACGFEDASGFEFPKGTSEVTYHVQDQPLLLITEIVQEGSDAIEITNFGPASNDITCLMIERIGNGAEVHVVPLGTVLGVGQTYVYNFNSNISENVAAGYQITLEGTQFDAVATNGYAMNGILGSLDGGDVWRTRVCDTNQTDDWAVATECDDSTMGSLNPGLSTMTDNGTTVALQSEIPNKVSCSFNVTVYDIEAPSCAEHDFTTYDGGSANINGSSCVVSSINVSGGLPIGQINISNLDITYPEMGDLTVYLEGPDGTRVTLFTGLCDDAANADVAFSDTTNVSIANAPCGPLGNGGIYKPEEALKAFYGKDAQGSWTLSINVNGTGQGSLNDWDLDVYLLDNYSQTNTEIPNIPGECGAEYTWTHPVLMDNCCVGTISVDYSSDDADFVPAGGFVSGGTTVTEYFAVGTTTVLYTLVDEEGNVNYCSFDLTVLDVENPVIVNCVSDMIISLDAGECCMVLNFPTPYATDNCGIESITFDPPTGISYCLGSHDITVTVTDESGNTATCSFNVQVNEFQVQEPFNFACNDLVYVSLGADCEALITADMLLEGNNYGCYENYCITITDLEGNVIPGNILDESHVGQYFNVSVGDCFTGGSSCWGQVFLENKTTPEIECPTDITLACNDPYDINSTGLVVLLSCEADAETTYTDQITDYGFCANPRAHITRTWLVTDDSGNTASCVQNITIIPFDLDDVLFPNDLTAGNALSCSDVNNDPSLLHPDNTGEPSIGGISLFGDHFCDVNIGYWDETLYDANCGGAYEILRHWVVRDECQPLVEGINPIKHIQAIKVEDFEGPDLQTFDDLTISTDSWGCGATYVLPTPYIVDNCTPSDDIQLSYSVVGGVIQNGVLYIQDPANGKTALVTVWAQDACGNTSSKSFTVHAIDDLAPNLVADAHTVVSVNVNGEAFSNAINFDDGSSDGCGPIDFFVRRMNTTCAGYEYEDNPNTWYDKVHFCCADIQFDNDGEPIPVMVQFRVCDDGNADNIIGNAGDNCATAMIEVVVQDKLAPELECPADITIECKNFAALGDLSDYTNAQLDQLFGSAYATSSCGNTYNQTITPKTLCGTGTINRIISVSTAGGSAACIQKIHVVADQEHKFSCDKMYFENYPESTYKWCLSASNGGPVQDFGAIQINSADCGEFTPQQLTIDYEDLCAVPYVNMTIDTFEFAGGGCFKYLVHWEVIDECVFDENFVDPATGETNPYHTANGYYHIYVEYDVFDNVGPVLDCVEEYIIPCDQGGLNQITLDGHDACTPDNFLSWNYTVDLGNNFTIDGQGTGNTATGPFPVGTHRIIWVVSDGCGNTTTENCVFSIVYDDTKAPTPVCHDGLSTAIMQPPACTIETWAIDFDASSYDDCDDELYFTMIPEVDAANSSDPYADATPSWVFDCSYITNGVFEEIPLRIYATDNTGKYDWCTTSLRIDDHFDCCEDADGMNLIIAGKVSTEEGEGVEEVTIQTMADSPEYPVYDITGPDGGYAFIFNPYFYDYVLTSDKSFGYLNGVTTLDLVMIQKHILNIDPLPSPYKRIAADINSDCNITALDLLQLRKLILGIYTDDVLPDNSSWRFVDDEYVFSNPEVYCGFDEILNIDLLEQDEYNMNFVGVKIGDVNASAQANANSSAETRNNESTNFIINAAKLNANETQWIDVYASDFTEVAGFQFTLNLDQTKAQFAAIKSGKLSIAENNLGLTRADEGLISVSWNNPTAVTATDQEVLFSLQLNTIADCDISELIQINDRRINAEIYKGQALEIQKIGLDIREGDNIYEQMSFELYQNEPNPFDKNTVIGFQLPEAGNVDLQLFDATGKLIKQISADFDKGYHEMQIHKSELSATGLIYYKLSAGAHTATRKMIILN